MRRNEHPFLPVGPISLDRLLPCQGAKIVTLGGSQVLRDRLRSLGLREGAEVVMVKQAPLADPVEYRVLGGHITLRREEARAIQVDEVVWMPGGFRHAPGRRHAGHWHGRCASAEPAEAAEPGAAGGAGRRWGWARGRGWWRRGRGRRSGS
ncbi:MAG: ferrous iron transport protein A [Candidatus Eisenbacteria sp.]|nr:ferrous iron transport protein A [Candidatus Eisenbacteria bacterium]